MARWPPSPPQRLQLFLILRLSPLRPRRLCRAACPTKKSCVQLVLLRQVPWPPSLVRSSLFLFWSFFLLFFTCILLELPKKSKRWSSALVRSACYSSRNSTTPRNNSKKRKPTTLPNNPRVSYRWSQREGRAFRSIGKVVCFLVLLPRSPLASSNSLCQRLQDAMKVLNVLKVDLERACTEAQTNQCLRQLANAQVQLLQCYYVSHAELLLFQART